MEVKWLPLRYLEPSSKNLGAYPADDCLLDGRFRMVSFPVRKNNRRDNLLKR
jgi:hypothetical protein